MLQAQAKPKALLSENGRLGQRLNSVVYSIYQCVATPFWLPGAGQSSEVFAHNVSRLRMLLVEVLGKAVVSFQRLSRTQVECLRKLRVSGRAVRDKNSFRFRVAPKVQIAAAVDFSDRTRSDMSVSKETRSQYPW